MQCVKCLEIKSIELFPKDKRKSTGVSSWCKVCHALAARRWSATNREVSQKKTLAWKAANSVRYREMQRKYHNERRKVDPLFKLSGNIRNLINGTFHKGGFAKKDTKTEAILGCDFDTLQSHLIQTAKNNYGGKYFPNRPYHIDHIIPVSSATTEEELIKLNHYTNLQLLYPRDNLRKGASY